MRFVGMSWLGCSASVVRNDRRQSKEARRVNWRRKWQTKETRRVDSSRDESGVLERNEWKVLVATVQEFRIFIYVNNANTAVSDARLLESVQTMSLAKSPPFRSCCLLRDPEFAESRAWAESGKEAIGHPTTCKRTRMV